MIMRARVQAGWIDEAALNPPAEEEAADEAPQPVE